MDHKILKFRKRSVRDGVGENRMKNLKRSFYTEDAIQTRLDREAWLRIEERLLRTPKGLRLASADDLRKVSENFYSILKSEELRTLDGKPVQPVEIVQQIKSSAELDSTKALYGHWLKPGKEKAIHFLMYNVDCAAVDLLIDKSFEDKYFPYPELHITFCLFAISSKAKQPA